MTAPLPPTARTGVRAVRAAACLSPRQFREVRAVSRPASRNPDGKIVHTGSGGAKRLRHLAAGVARAGALQGLLQPVDDFVVAGVLAGRRADQQHELAPLRDVRTGGEIAEPAVPHVFMQFGELARDHGLAVVTEDSSHVRQRLGNTGGRLKKDQGRRHVGELGEPLTAGTLPGRQKSCEQEAIRRQTRTGQRRDRRRWSRHADDPVAGLHSLAHQLETRIGHQRGPGIADQRDCLAGGKVLQDPRTFPILIVLVVRRKAARQPIVVEKLAAVARVFAQHAVGSSQDPQRTQRQIRQMTDRCRHEVQSRVQGLRENIIEPGEDTRAQRVGCRVINLLANLPIFRQANAPGSPSTGEGPPAAITLVELSSMLQASTVTGATHMRARGRVRTNTMVPSRAWTGSVLAFATCLAALLLAACAIQGGSEMLPGGENAATDPSASPQPGGDAIKVALLLPLTSTGHTAAVAKGLKQAGEMAMFDLDNPNFQLIVKDDKSTPEGARAAAEEAIKEGAELIIGPLFAKSVVAIAPATQAANVPVLAFSNDRQVVGKDIYLLGFLPEQEVDRIISYSAQQGHRRFAAILPDTPYGKLTETAFRNAVSRVGGSIAAFETYKAETNSMVEPSQRVASALRSAAEARQPVEALFVPGGPETLPNLGPLLHYANIDTTRIKVLGTSGWDYPNIGREGAFIDGWFPAPDPRGWRDFSERFAKTFGSAPPRLASMAYDAVTVAIKLSGQPKGTRFSAASLTRASGFSGVDGPFRLSQSGYAERGLAVLQVQNIGTKLLDPPSGFGAATVSSSILNPFN